MRTTVSFITLCASCLVTSCQSPAEKTFSPKPLRDLCIKWGGVPLVVPDSRYVPGALFQLRPKQPPTFLDTNEFLKSCHVPAELLSPIEGTALGSKVSQSVEYGADAVLGYEGIEAGADFSSVRSASLNVGDARPSGLPVPRINVWMQDNPDALSQSCKTQLSSPEYYVVGDTLRIAHSDFELHDKTGGKINVSAPQLRRLVNVKPSAKVNVTTDGRLTIDQPVTVCVRQLSYRGGALQVLSAVQPDAPRGTGDQALLSYYDEATEKD